MHGQNRVGELPRLDPARMSHFHAYNYPCERADHEDGEGATRPLGWFAAAYFLAVVVIGGIILPTLLTAVIAASTVRKVPTPPCTTRRTGRCAS